MTSGKPHCVIIGSGPSGSAAACALLPANQVTLVDPFGSGVRPFRAGESLPAAAGRILGGLGLSHCLDENFHRRTERRFSRWGSDNLETQDSFLNPDGSDFLLDRRKFENDLIKEALGRGATHLPAKVQAACGHDHHWNLTLSNGDTLLADWVIDASGRSASFARLAGEKRIRHDRLVCHWQLGKSAGRVNGSYLQSCETGWWYSAAIPAHGRLLAFFSDPGVLLPNWREVRGLDKCLEDDGFQPEPYVKKTAAHSQSLSRPFGWRWHAIGDASLAFDPLSSQGIFHALYTAMISPTVIATCGNEYAREIASIQDAYRSHFRTFYSQEKRWPDSPFWSSRNGPLSHLTLTSR
jgi:flavin-dependent dehydrogenase